MSTLEERLQNVDRDLLVRDIVTLIDEEVQSKGGFSGVALKTGYKAVKRLRGGNMIEDAADALLDDFARALTPMYDDYLADDSYADFEGYLADNRNEAAEALLGITDRKTQEADSKIIRKTYEKLRGSAEKHVKEALPRVGQLIDKHAPRG